MSNEQLRQAAQAVVDRWDSPKWKDLPHTGVFIDALRAALSHPEHAGQSGWQPIETAPKDGTHIVVTVRGKGGFGYFDGMPQDWSNVVHWFQDGFYGSVYCGDQKEPFTGLTHWASLTTPAPEAQSAQPQQRTTEREFAVMDGYRVAASDAYFAARPQIESIDRRRVYGAAYKQGWEDFQLGRPTPATQPAEQAQSKPLFGDLIAAHEGLAEELKAVDAQADALIAAYEDRNSKAPAHSGDGERAELIQFLKDNACGGSEYNQKMLRAAALLTQDAKAGVGWYCKKCVPVCTGGHGCFAGEKEAKYLKMVGLKVMPQPAAVPLTEERILREVEDQCGITDVSNPAYDYFEQGVRFAERAHGITAPEVKK